MKKLCGVLIVIIFALAIVSGLLCYQLSDMQSKNAKLEKQNSDLENQLGELEGQLSDYQNRTDQLENQILELESQIGELQNPVYTLEITAFSVASTWDNPGGMAFGYKSNITIQNNGKNDVRGLTLLLKRFGAGFGVGSTYVLLDTLHAGEERVIETSIPVDFALIEYKPVKYVATLNLGPLVLDEFVLS
jgi:cell division protein FtsL